MPASKFTKKANTPRRSRQWMHVYRSALSSGDSESKAITKASGVVKRDWLKARRKSR